MKISNSLTYVLLALLFFALVLLNNTLFKSARMDLTENQVFTMSCNVGHTLLWMLTMVVFLIEMVNG